MSKIVIPRVVIAGLRGGGGKTTLSFGLTAALAARGMRVAPFKKGPDYIDAGWLAAAAGVPCHNLDSYLNTEELLRYSFIKHSRNFDISVMEGNRGLFDGMDAEGSYSTSAVARIIKAPVVLVVDCTKSSRTVAAMVLGAKKFERGLNLAGVVLNQYAGARHRKVVTEAIEKYAGVPVLGAIPRLKEVELPERHMGLVPWQEHPDLEASIKRAAAIVNEYVDIDAILRIARDVPAITSPRSAKEYDKTYELKDPPTIGVIRDSAFQFYYPENIEELKRRGAKVIEFSALTEKALPPVDTLYIGGGFPETHAVALARNTSFMNSLKIAVSQGLPVYAECGGIMYLGKTLELGNKKYKMSGILPLNFRMHEKPHGHGYTEVKVTKKNPFFKVGTTMRGHEFHYSEVINADITLALKMKRGKGIKDKHCGVLMDNVFATYTHVHALGSPQWADGMLHAAKAYKHKTLSGK
jgi:cobyrinic acid a,c-diamide synthase